MPHSVNTIIKREVKLLFQLKKTERLWHIPLLASLCTGLPLLIGYFLNRLDYGILACIGGLVILYLPSTKLEHRMVTLLMCAFGFMFSYGVGISFSFHPVVTALVLGLFTFGVNWLSNYFRLRPPGSFFFIMLASMGSCVPFDLMMIPTRIGLIGVGTIIASIFALLYSLYITRKYPDKLQGEPLKKRNYTNITESLIIGLFISITLIIGRVFHFDNPYWLPISCLAIMQGVSLTHVWQRGFHRILGTLIGLGLTWLLLLMQFQPLGICCCILCLQFIVEMLIVRHYALTVIFLTPMTIFLAEIGNAMHTNPNRLISIRLLDIVIGSLIGVLGGWLLHHQQLHLRAERQIRKTRVALLRK